jgi:hypothetical protein
MHRRVFILSAICAGVVIAVIFWRNGKLPDFSAKIGRAVQEVQDRVTGNARRSESESFQISGPGEVVAQSSVDVLLPYGSITIKPGTRLWALRQTEKGVVTRFGGHEVTLPAALFRPVNESTVSP